jgi:hypothetical protein
VRPRRVEAKQQRSEFKGDFRKLGLDVRVVNALATHGILALEDLAHFTDRELGSLRGIGPGTRNILQDYLKKEHQPGSDQSPAISLVLSAKFLRAIDDWCLAYGGATPNRGDSRSSGDWLGDAKENGLALTQIQYVDYVYISL